MNQFVRRAVHTTTKNVGQGIVPFDMVLIDNYKMISNKSSASKFNINVGKTL